MNRSKSVVMIALTALLCGACASSTSAGGDAAYDRFLVLALADNYTNRAQYERTVARELRAAGVAATPYHQAVGGNGDISRERALELIAEHDYDAVLVTQVRSSSTDVAVTQQSTSTKVTRKDNTPIDFFRYDYEDLDDPGEMSLLAEATLDSALHRANDGTVVWRYGWNSKSAANVGALIDQSAAALTRKLERDRMLSR